MVISFTCNNIGTGGAERVICNLANRMAKDGHSIRIICYEKLKSFYYELEENVEVIELDSKINQRSSFISRKLVGFVNLARLFCAVKGSDRVVSFYSRQNCYSILVCNLLRIPVICAERDHFFMSDGKANHILRKLFYPHANGFIHQTNMARDFLRKNEGVCCEDIVIPNPIWMTSFSERNPISGNIIAVGRLEEQKNYKGMLNAFSLVVKKEPRAILSIYGDGTQKEELIKLVQDLHIEQNVIFKGMTKNVIEAYRTADIYILFSHGEGYPNALMEALAMGVPSVSSDCPVGGPRDMIKDGINGFLVPCDDEVALADRIIKLFGDSSLKKRFSDESKVIRSSNQFDTIYNKYMKFIISVSR
ncbi:MAG: glycosyltransferase [Lachnospiraceae bacterium]|nr:glycosyltransferase [Lachnospiraceae bacterium]